MNPEVREAFDTLEKQDLTKYHDYWKGVAPTDDQGIFQRYLFAFCSVHTTWKGNVRGYTAIKDFHPVHWTLPGLRDALLRSGCGMHNNRSTWIWAFGMEYWKEPTRYQKAPGEALGALRDRLLGSIKGLGIAKLTFALEMAYPVDPALTVACLDVHMLRLYNAVDLNGNGSGTGLRQYQRLEADWVGRSYGLKTSPYVTRMAYWDRVQGQQDSRYWSHVFE